VTGQARRSQPRIRRRALALCAVTLALLAGTALAAPGDLDTGFDGDGAIAIDFGGDTAKARAVAL
jgi:hypothetical protein